MPNTRFTTTKIFAMLDMDSRLLPLPNRTPVAPSPIGENLARRDGVYQQNPLRESRRSRKIRDTRRDGSGSPFSGPSAGLPPEHRETEEEKGRGEEEPAAHEEGARP